MSGSELVRIGIVIGDPAGIGPEIATKVLAGRDHEPNLAVFAVGHVGLVTEWAERIGSARPVRVMASTDPDEHDPDSINVIHVDCPEALDVRPGETSESAGRASIAFAERGAQLALSRHVDALLTCPVSKASVKRAGVDLPGQAEFYAQLSGAPSFVTVLISGELKAALLTTHCSLLDACRAVTAERILDRLRFIDRFGAVVGAAKPRIAVAALNPHGGEGGMLGSEEIDEIVPAVERARALGIDVHGPFPVNGILAPYRGGYDFVLAMYHDQAVAAMDMLRTTTLTLGLPFIRTSVGHGTGLDIAGTGVASAVPLDDALTATVGLARASAADASSQRA